MHTEPLSSSMSLQVPCAMRPTGYARLLEESMRKDVFLATLAHELRNMISPLRCALAVLEQGRLDSHSARRALPVAQRQVHHMSHLVDDLLDVGRMIKGEVSMCASVVSLRRLAEETLEACAPLLTGQTLSADLGDDELRGAGDPVRLAQVLTNLLHNAAKFTPGSGTIRVEASRVDAWAVLCVSDNGIGIAPGQLDSIFSMFSQEGRAREQRDEGLGIGLALVRKLVELHGGSVDCASDGPGLGATFTIRLPLAEDH